MALLGQNGSSMSVSPLSRKLLILCFVKQLTHVAYISIQSVLLALWSNPKNLGTAATPYATSITIVSYSIILYASCIEHVFSIRPSSIITLYLGPSFLLDLLRMRTLFGTEGQQITSKLYAYAVLVKFIATCLEALPKRNILFWQWKDESPITTTGLFGLALYTWVNPLLWSGYKTKTTLYSLPTLPKKIQQAARPVSLMEKWESTAYKEKKNALMWIFVSHFKWDILITVLPRTLHYACAIFEPFLLEQVLVLAAEPDSRLKRQQTSLLTVVYGLTHLARAIGWTLNCHFGNSFRTKLRGSLAAIIYSKLTTLRASETEKGDAITLMSSDIDRIEQNANAVHRTYISIFVLVSAIWMLFRLVGLSVVAPAIFTIVCILIGMPISSAVGRSHGPWLEAIEERMDVTSKMIGGLKAMKMTGLTGRLTSDIHDLRTQDIKAASWHRLIKVVDMGLYYISTNLLSVMGLGTYAILAWMHGTAPLTEGVAFSALALFQLLREPLGQLVTIFEFYETLSTSFGRLQDFLLSEDRHDLRLQQAEDTSNSVLSVVNGGVSYGDTKVALQNINLDVERGLITMIVGPVGCGKTTLLKLLLGEIPEYTGTVQTSHRESAYCAQSPWVTWGTIRSNIVGPGMFDQTWYNTVVNSCALPPDLDALPKGDMTATGSRGSRLSGGQQARIALARALYSKNPLMIFDDVLTGLDRITERAVLDDVFGSDGVLKQLECSVVLATNTTKHLHYADRIVVLGPDGSIIEQGDAKYILESSDYVKRLAGQAPKEVPTEVVEASNPLEEFGITDDDLNEIDSHSPAGDLDVYWFYINIIGKRLFFIYAFLCATAVAGYMLPSLWLQAWTKANATHPNENLVYWLGIYVLIVLACILGGIVSDYALELGIIPKASRRIHDMMLATATKAKISWITSMSAGHLTSRFGQDLDLIDDDWPNAIEAVLVELVCTIIAAIMICLGSFYMAFAVPLCIIILYPLQAYYLKTSREIRLLGLETKAPLFSLFLETGVGISSIRAYGWTKAYEDQNYQLLNDSQKPFLYLQEIEAWLALVLELLVAGLTVFLVWCSLSLPGFSSGLLGVALFNVIYFSETLEDLVISWTDLEASIGAIARVKRFLEDTEVEDDSDCTAILPQSWPSVGSVDFESLSATYEKQLAPSINNISLQIQPGEKVAICGRTGSGKSSMISSLLAMLEVTSGRIMVDGVNINTIPHELLRERINTISQGAFFFPGSVRDNADPLRLATDEAIIDALQAVQLWELLKGRGGLDEELSETALSHGERQLFCLARAIIKPGKIVIFDEATSSVDSDTDEILQKVVRTRFEDRTLISIAHKLHTIMDFDKVVMLDHGRIAEIGNPKTLLGTPGSAFKALYDSMD
ncbi:hypothetical protein VHEMI02002 [[Torrubiella] hemipterigena]|uniref:ABC transporter n=1 Tax=[Torrubiella] hemipterigena TaxID=1531966 RepID=A0A0A1T6I0_9HYPO|nr:hypothetical protein VHEMI02002 [[Torrubiella] hemipterigena]